MSDDRRLRYKYSKPEIREGTVVDPEMEKKKEENGRILDGGKKRRKTVRPGDYRMQSSSCRRPATGMGGEKYAKGVPASGVELLL